MGLRKIKNSPLVTVIAAAGAAAATSAAASAAASAVCIYYVVIGGRFAPPYKYMNKYIQQKQQQHLCLTVMLQSSMLTKPWQLAC